MSRSRHVLAETAFGIATVDVDTGELVGLEDGAPLPRPSAEGVSLPRTVAADAYGSRVVAVVDRKPPLLVSDDAGSTWRDAGGGLPPGKAVAISREHPDFVIYASTSRLFVSTDGGRFWQALAPELEEIRAVVWDY
ncbi:MAG TPA: hypothetical protein VHH57_06525 [Gaiella sp.]|nr:hypothetical protein [Gaiella sp.]